MSAAHTPGPWQPMQVGRHWIVTRYYPDGGHDTLSNTGRRVAKFRSADVAEKAMLVATVIDALRCAIECCPEQRDNHVNYYVGKLVSAGLSEKEARAAIARATGAAQ